jgi:endo-1,4-beta-xylanase
LGEISGADTLSSVLKMLLVSLRLEFLLGLVSLCVQPLQAQSLRECAQKRGVSIGTAVRPQLFSERLYASTLAREFSMLEPEDAMKWWVIRSEEAKFDFTQADLVVNFAETHHMKVRGHTLVWGWSNPDWLSRNTFTTEQLRLLLQEHIERVVSRYRGRVFAWDVVNEAFDQDGSLKHSLWYDHPGIGLSTDYIEQAFRWAHDADPEALLFYNDNGAETLNRKSDAIYAMVKDFKRRGVPIDGMGMQMHIFDLKANTDSIARNIARFAALGLQVHITEMDIAVPVDAMGRASASDLARQADLYGEIAAACFASHGCTAIQTWGFTDKYSWIGWKTKGAKGNALVFDDMYLRKNAYLGLEKACQETPQAAAPVPAR